MRFWRYCTASILAAFLILSPLTLPLTAFAQSVPDQGLSLQISPLPIQLSVNPGTSSSTDLRVRNTGVQTERLQVRILKVTEDDNGLVHLSNPKASDTWVKWISFSRTVFDAPSNQWQTITMNVNLPKEAAFGYYFAVEYLRAVDQAPQPGKEVAHGAVATFILLDANAPGASRQAQVVSFKADRKSYEFLPATFSVKIRANGNVEVAPSGNIFISKGGKQIDAIQINQTGGNILPNSSRIFSAAWNNGFPNYVTKVSNGQPVSTKSGQPAQSLKWDFSHANRLRFGHYTANLVMVYDNGQRDVPLQASVSFWVIPWRLVGGIILIVIFMAVGFWSTFRRIGGFAKKQTKRARSYEKHAEN